METKLYPPNAILFVFDLANKDVKVPEYIDGVLIVSNETCISVGTQADVDGEVSVHLFHKSSTEDMSSCSKVFGGNIGTPGEKVAVVTADMDKVLELDVDSEDSKVSIWTDHNQYPSRVMIEVG